MLSQAEPPTRKPFVLPFTAPAGPMTWMFEQAFGNTTDAYNFGKYWYAAGQGLHFGIDLEAPCGTPVHAIGNGIVEWIDNSSFGAGPHNLVLRHAQYGYISVYGHLSQVLSTLKVGDTVKQGQMVAKVGDPDLNCQSRPHLHLEIRSLDYNTIFNPIPLIEADWQRLFSTYPMGVGSFAKDLRNPQRWQTLLDQPNITAYDRIVNAYENVWPTSYRFQASTFTALASTAPPIVENLLTPHRLTLSGCCSQPWWTYDSQSIEYVNMVQGKELAQTWQISVLGGAAKVVDTAPPAIVSPDLRYEVRGVNGARLLVDRKTNQQMSLFTRRAWPQFSPSGKQLLWQFRAGDDIPGEISPQTEVWIMSIGVDEGRLLFVQSGGSVRWLDEWRLLIAEYPSKSQQVTLKVYDIQRQTSYTLLETAFMRGLSVAPGGQYLMYYTLFQQVPTSSGVFLLETRQGAKPQKLDFFGGWRWRDSHSIVYIPFEESAMRFVLYDITTRRSRPLTQPSQHRFQVATSQWDISPDGRYIMYVEAQDNAIWVLPLSEASLPNQPDLF